MIPNKRKRRTNVPRHDYCILEDRRLLASSTVIAEADSYTRPNVNAGNAEVLQVLDQGGGDFMAYIRFKLSNLNIDQITSAELTLHKVPGLRNDTIVSGRFDIYGLPDLSGNTSQNWQEATLAESGLGDEYNNTSGNALDFERVVNLDQESGADVTENVNNAQTAQKLSGPALVDFLNARVDANGYATLIALVDAGIVRGWGYGSSENPDPNLRPSLTLEYSQFELPRRQVERLDRGVVAVRSSNSHAYVGWRLLGNDPAEIGFHVYRSANGADPVRLTNTPLTQTTDFVDTTANFSVDNVYSVRPIIEGVEQSANSDYRLPADSAVQQRISVPLQIPAPGQDFTYSANDTSVGDLDGDGQYELVVKWDPSNASDNTGSVQTGNQILDAYRLNGDLLWRIDLGRNIRSGPHYTQFMVYDFDGDGRSELITKTAPGTIDGLGNPVLMGDDQVGDDYRQNGFILTGPEYLTVFDGLTGANLSTIAFEPARGHVSEWGDDYGNRVDRFTAGVAYLDGTRPSLVFGRGYYHPRLSTGQARNEVAAYDFRDGQLSLRWHFKAGENINDDINVEYVGQGAHSLTIGDVDFDGRDEIIYGAAAIDDDGTGLYSTQLGHGDALHLSDMDPSRPGQEVFMVHENEAEHGGVGGEFRDAATGELIFSVPGSGDVGRGVAADIDPHSPGFEFWHSANNQIYSSAGEPLYAKPSNMFQNFVVWWDADLTRELLDRTTISEWNNPGRSNFDLDPGTAGTQIFAPGASSNNGTKATPALSADLFGDWREEVIWRRTDSSFLDIYTTIIPSTTRLFTLMHDTQYRTAIAWQNTGYNQPPHPSFFLGADMDPPPDPRIFYAGTSAIVSQGVAYGGATAAYGENKIDPTKTPLFPGNDATKDNYTNYIHGLNRITIDFDSLPTASIVSGALNPENDFVFQVGNTANSDQWPTLTSDDETGLPSISLSAGETDGQHRATLAWPNGAITNSWLRVAVQPTANTGLDSEYVFYFGNQIADVFGTTLIGSRVRVNSIDTVQIRVNQSANPNSVGIDNPYDIDRSGAVNSLDTLRARLNQMATGGLLMLGGSTLLSTVTGTDPVPLSNPLPFLTPTATFQAPFGRQFPDPRLPQWHENDQNADRSISPPAKPDHRENTSLGSSKTYESIWTSPEVELPAKPDPREEVFAFFQSDFDIGKLN